MWKKGFTLIELVIVIVILGILAAVAVPKFVNLKDDAEKAAIEGIVGAIRSAKNIFLAKMLTCDPADYTTVDNLVKSKSLLTTFISYDPNGDPRTEWDCKQISSGKIYNTFEFKSDIRNSIMKYPSIEIGYKNPPNNDIVFETKSGRTVTIYYDNNTQTIGWTASPSY